MKKVLSVLLSLVLLSSLSVFVFAENNPPTTTVQYGVQPSYTTFIPPSVTAGNILTIGASVNADPGMWVVVKISGGLHEGNAVLNRLGANGWPEAPAEDNVLSVPIRIGERPVWDSNVIVALFDGTEPVEIATRSVSVGAPDTTGKKAGNYEGTVTFSISYQSMANTVTPVVPNGDEYTIWNDIDWLWFASQTESYMYSKTSDLCGKTIKLNSNLDLTPYGNAAMAIVPAGATFDGSYYSVKVNFNRKESSGLFQVADSCTIKDLTVTGSMQVVNGRVGIIASALADKSAISIDHCTNFATIRLTSDLSGVNDAAGGIVGMTNGSYKVDITNCINNGEISATGTKESISGGIVGVIANNASGNLIQYCTNSSNIYTDQCDGGIIGFTSETLTIDSCNNNGTLYQLGSNVTYTYPIFFVNNSSQLVVTNCWPSNQNGTHVFQE